MTLTSFDFFVFLLITLLLFYIFRPVQKYILAAASLTFYMLITTRTGLKQVALVAFIGLVTYVGALLTESLEGKAKSAVLWLSIAGLAAALFVFKYAANVLETFASIFNSPADFSWIKFGSIIGLSYYALSAMGYLIDVYWGNVKAGRNIAEVFLFVSYFPQLISGPVTRYGEIHAQICEPIRFDVDRFLHGLRRMIWGYFKKLVISERFAIAVTAVYKNYTEYSFVGVVGATLCYAIQLYTDFSGCMDIIMGASEMFGISLPENFNAPFFSESIQEFWQRWHITLGTWFKDYLMYPLQKSSGIQKAGKWAKTKLGKKAGKKIPFYLSMLALWILIGLWHGGTGYYFVASAAIPCVFLIFSDLCQPAFKKLVSILRINTECGSWRWFRRIRTLLLVCICWMVVCSGSMAEFGAVVSHSFSNLWNYKAFNAIVETMGFTAIDILIMAIGVVVLYLADTYTYRGESIFKVVDRQNYLIRVGIVYLELFIILTHGMVGTSSFIYFQF